MAGHRESPHTGFARWLEWFLVDWLLILTLALPFGDSLLTYYLLI